jgi:DNA-directed RNA polymerase subunit RPC12/RpoP
LCKDGFHFITLQDDAYTNLNNTINQKRNAWNYSWPSATSVTGDYSPVADMGKYKCAQCGNSYRYASGLSRHKLVHKQKQLFCPFCQRVFLNYNTLFSHKKMCTRRQEFPRTISRYHSPHNENAPLTSTHPAAKQSSALNNSDLDLGGGNASVT